MHSEIHNWSVLGRGGSRMATSALAIISVLMPIGHAQAQTLIVDDGDTIAIPDDYAPGTNDWIQVKNGGSLSVMNVAITGTRTGSTNAVLQVNGGTVTLSGSSVTMSKEDSWGNALMVSGDAEVMGTDVILDSKGSSASSGSPSAGLYAADNARVHLTGGAVTTSGQRGYAVRTSGNGWITLEDVDVQTGGADSYGVQAYGNGNSDSLTEITIIGGSVTTTGRHSAGLQAGRLGSLIKAEDLSILTYGEESRGMTADRGGVIELSDVTVETRGNLAAGIRAYRYDGTADSIVTGERVSITTKGNYASGLLVDTEGTGGSEMAGASIQLADSHIHTEGLWAHGAHAIGAANGGTNRIVLEGGSITTANARGKGSQDGDGSRAYALFAEKAGAEIEARNVTISTVGQRAYGAYALNGGSIILDGGSIDTQGFMAYGIYASGEGSKITASNLTITTSGQVGDAAWAYAGGVLDLDGVNIHVTGEPNPREPHEMANGLVALGGTDSASAGVIHARNVTILTEGNNSAGLLIGADVGATRTSGEVHIADSSVTVTGEHSVAAWLSYGSSLEAEGSTLISDKGAGIVLSESAAVNLVDVTVKAAEESIRSTLSLAGQVQEITIGAGSDLTENNGTLIVVTRTEEGTDGQVILTLQEGSTSRGDIIDLGDKSAGGSMTVYLREGADWKGTLQGVDNFVSSPGGRSEFEDGSKIAGDLGGENSDFVFNGDATIGGNVVGDGSKFAFGSNGTTEISGDVTGQNSTISFGSNSTNIIGGSVTGTNMNLTVGQNAVTEIAGTLEGTGSSFDFSHGGDTTIGGNVVGGNTSFVFSPQGATVGGDVTLLGTSSTAGGTVNTPIIVQGNVFADGSTAFGGNWNIGGNLQSYGFITPGNSIGIIKVGGNHSFGADAVYETEISSDGEADRIEVGGIASLAGSVKVVPLAGDADFRPGHAYTILTAEGGFDPDHGAFDSVSWDLDYLFLTPALQYDDTSVSVVIGRNGTAFAAIAETANQAATAAALDALDFGNDAHDTVALASADVARAAYELLSGEIHATAKSTLLDDSRYLRNGVLNHIRAAVTMGGDERAREIPGTRLNMWVEGYGAWARLEGNANAARAKRDVGGFTLGVDGAVSDNWCVGFATGYGKSSTHVAARLSSLDVESYHLSAYAGGQLGRFGIRIGASHSWHSLDSDRTVAFAGFSDVLVAEYDGRSAQAFADIGYALDANGATLEPFVNVAMLRVDLSAFRERGGDGALAADDAGEEFGIGTLGMRAAQKFAIGAESTLSLRGSAGWQRVIGDVSPEAVLRFADGAGQFRIEGTPVARNAAVFEAGLDLAIGNNFVVGAGYTGQISGNHEDHGLTAHIALKF